MHCARHSLSLGLSLRWIQDKASQLQDQVQRLQHQDASLEAGRSDRHSSIEHTSSSEQHKGEDDVIGVQGSRIEELEAELHQVS